MSEWFDKQLDKTTKIGNESFELVHFVLLQTNW